MARRYIDMGFYLGIGGVVIYTNAKILRDVVKYIPLESIVLETDSPFLPPVPYRRERKTSLSLKFVAE